MAAHPLIRKALTAVIGGLLAAAGVVLLVLPGPGVVLIALGLAVLAREFTWAAKPLHWAERRAQEGLEQVADHAWVAVADAAAGLALVAVPVVDLTVGLPYLSIVSDVFLVLGGLFLVGSVVYARRGGRFVGTGTGAEQ